MKRSYITLIKNKSSWGQKMKSAIDRNGQNLLSDLLNNTEDALHIYALYLAKTQYHKNEIATAFSSASLLSHLLNELSSIYDFILIENTKTNINQQANPSTTEDNLIDFTFYNPLRKSLINKIKKLLDRQVMLQIMKYNDETKTYSIVKTFNFNEKENSIIKDILAATTPDNFLTIKEKKENPSEKERNLKDEISALKTQLIEKDSTILQLQQQLAEKEQQLAAKELIIQKLQPSELKRKQDIGIQALIDFKKPKIGNFNGEPQEKDTPELNFN